MRLAWLCGLTLGNGQLLPGFTAARKFQLTKWPQIEREYPKHFRLATVMMKGPALAKEIAEAAGVPVTEVVDFVNAGLMTGAVVVEGSNRRGRHRARQRLWRGREAAEPGTERAWLALHGPGAGH